MTRRNPSERSTVLDFAKAQSIIDSVRVEDVERYRTYWESIRPKTHEEVYRRWVFAICSVRTSWESNVRAFRALDALPRRPLCRDEVEKALYPTGCGLWEMRARGIEQLSTAFHTDPRPWYPGERESMPDARDRLQESVFGLGAAKTSFALEMTYPLSAQVVCADTHMLQWYGLSGRAKLTRSAYRMLEQHWLTYCQHRGLPATLVRHICFDSRQGFVLSSYWSDVFLSGGEAIPANTVATSPSAKEDAPCSTSSPSSSASPARLSHPSRSTAIRRRPWTC